MSELKTQTALILAHLQLKGNITSYESFVKYKVTRLSAVIYLLKKQGCTFRTEREYNRITSTNYARYYLTGEPK
jgi:hypothetical protein